MTNHLGFVEAIETWSAYRYVCFDLFEESLLPPLEQMVARGLHEPLELRTSLLTIETEDQQELSLPIVEGAWYKLKLGAGPNKGTFFRSAEDSGGEMVPVAIGGRLPDSYQERLQQLFSMERFPSANVDDIEHALAAPGTNGGFVACFDVGQGNCNAVCDNAGRPLLYFDLGAGVGPHAKTTPANLRLCFSNQQPIVLSHWDMDHWIMGLRDPRAQKSVWIAPKQKSKGLTTFNFQNALALNGKLLLCSKGMPAIITHHGTLRKLSARDWNDSGLVLEARTTSPVGGAYQTLLPGDAQYLTMAFPPCHTFDAIIAPHHGGSLKKGTQVPWPSNRLAKNVVAYSCGKTNWGHPVTKTKTAHSQVGWNRALETKSHGNIGLVIDAGAVPQLACSDNCTLQIKAT